MDNKVRIGGQSDEITRATDAEKGIAKAQSDLTMMQRRVRTFYLAVSEVVFPAEAPSWANDWVEWLLTGTVVPVEEVGEETATEEIDVEAAAAEAAGDVEEAVTETVAASNDEATPTI